MLDRLANGAMNALAAPFRAVISPFALVTKGLGTTAKSLHLLCTEGFGSAVSHYFKGHLENFVEFGLDASGFGAVVSFGEGFIRNEARAW